MFLNEGLDTENHVGSVAQEDFWGDVSLWGKEIGAYASREIRSRHFVVSGMCRDNCKEYD